MARIEQRWLPSLGERLDEAVDVVLAFSGPGTVAIVKRSARLDVASVGPRGSVVTPGSVSFKPPTMAWTHA